jgi:AcrR family transcriptional regulator
MPIKPIEPREPLDLRTRIIEVASELVAAGGVAALTTRAVAAAASVQAPTLYRLFGDKRGLLDAVAEQGLAEFIARKASAPPHADPVQDLRDAWDAYVVFGLDNPAVFAIMHDIGAVGPASPAVGAGLEVLRKRIGRLARAGMLRLPEERAVALVHAAGVGTVSTLLAVPREKRDPDLSPTARDAVMAALIAESKEDVGHTIGVFAIGLRAHLGAAEGLTPGEHLMLTELLDRLSARRI